MDIEEGDSPDSKLVLCREERHMCCLLMTTFCDTRWTEDTCDEDGSVAEFAILLTLNPTPVFTLFEG